MQGRNLNEQTLTYYSLLSKSSHTWLDLDEWLVAGQNQGFFTEISCEGGSAFPGLHEEVLGIWVFSPFAPSLFVLLSWCCLGVGPCASIQLNGVRIPVKLHRYMANILVGLKVWIVFLLWSAIAQVKLPWGNNISSCEEKERVVDVQLLHFIKVSNPFFPIILEATLVQIGTDKWMLNEF